MAISSSDRLAVGTWGHLSQRHGPHHQGCWGCQTCLISFAQIHNTNNENAWGEVLKWERFHKAECPEPQVRSIGYWSWQCVTFLCKNFISTVEKFRWQGQRLFTKSKTERNAWISDAFRQVYWYAWILNLVFVDMLECSMKYLLICWDIRCPVTGA